MPSYQQKGFAPIIVVVGILIGLTALGGGYIASKQTSEKEGQAEENKSWSISIDELNLDEFKTKEFKSSESGALRAEINQQSTPEPVPEQNTKSQSAFDIILQRLNLKSTPKPTVKPTPTPTPTPKATVMPLPSTTTATTTPTPTPSAFSNPTSTPTPTPATSATSTPAPSASAAASTSTSSGSAYCEVHTSPSGGTAPLEVQLIYGMGTISTAGWSGDIYVKEVQWDWDGDGNWDTDYSVNNQQLKHTFTTSGSHNLRLHLKLNNGYETPVCTGSITLN